MKKKDIIIIIAAIVMAAVTGIATHFGVNSVLLFVFSAIALVLLAMNVGHATDQLGSRMGPGATGVLQSALGNLPELFVCIFALRAGLDKVVQAALVGSIWVSIAIWRFKKWDTKI
jgi:Ca2+:H+ antiporter